MKPKTAEREEALATLQEMTRAEIISWLSGEIGFLLRPPRKSQLLFARWQAASDAVMARRERNNLADGVAKKMDALGAEMRAAKTHAEYLALFKEYEPYRKQFDAWTKELKAIQKEDEKAEVLYQAYLRQSEAERAAGAGKEQD